MFKVNEANLIQETEFRPPVKIKKKQLPHGRTLTRAIIDTMNIGECLRIKHKDIACNYKKYGDNVFGYSCSLVTMCWFTRKEGKRFEHYHEDGHIAVVTRLM